MSIVDRIIRTRLHSDVALVNQMSEYIINNGGKRLRPALVVLSAKALGYTGEYQGMSKVTGEALSIFGKGSMLGGLASIIAGVIAGEAIELNHEEYVNLGEKLELLEEILENELEERQEKRELLGLE